MQGSKRARGASDSPPPAAVWLAGGCLGLGGTGCPGCERPPRRCNGVTTRVADLHVSPAMHPGIVAKSPPLGPLRSLIRLAPGGSTAEEPLGFSSSFSELHHSQGPFPLPRVSPFYVSAGVASPPKLWLANGRTPAGVRLPAKQALPVLFQAIREDLGSEVGWCVTCAGMTTG